LDSTFVGQRVVKQITEEDFGDDPAPDRNEALSALQELSLFDDVEPQRRVQGEYLADVADAELVRGVG
jgi:hypothetical protein